MKSINTLIRISRCCILFFLAGANFIQGRKKKEFFTFCLRHSFSLTSHHSKMLRTRLIITISNTRLSFASRNLAWPKKRYLKILWPKKGLISGLRSNFLSLNNSVYHFDWSRYPIWSYFSLEKKAYKTIACV